jgi:excisionase family DNA binding protein
MIMTPPVGTPLLTRDEVAALLKVHPKTVTRLPIPSVMLGKRLRRWRRVDVDKFLEERAA